MYTPLVIMILILVRSYIQRYISCWLSLSKSFVCLYVVVPSLIRSSEVKADLMYFTFLYDNLTLWKMSILIVRVNQGNIRSRPFFSFFFRYSAAWRSRTIYVTWRQRVVQRLPAFRMGFDIISSFFLFFRNRAREPFKSKI